MTILSVCYDYRDIARGKERVPIPVTNDVDSTNYPTDFVYVTESVWTSPVPINTTISSLQVPVFTTTSSFINISYFGVAPHCLAIIQFRGSNSNANNISVTHMIFH